MSEFDLLTDKADFSRSEWRRRPPSPPPPGGVSLEVERFALTANNFTYAKFGEALGYWRYFPAPEGFGRMPVWGLARIIDSAHPQFRGGERVFGFLPISTQFTLLPEMRGALRFVDADSGRAELPAVYNEYALVDRDPGFAPERANAYIALRPLFLLGFVLAEWLMESGGFSADRVIVSSASSKAALAFAHQLGGRIPAFGLTSPRHVVDVGGWGVYENVASYQDIGGFCDGRAVFVDFAGDPHRAVRIRERLGDRLIRMVRVGATHAEATPSPDELRASDFFFAPAHIGRLKAQWGGERLRARLAENWANFLAFADERLSFRVFAGRSETDRVYREAARGVGAAGIVNLLADLRQG